MKCMPVPFRTRSKSQDGSPDQGLYIHNLIECPSILLPQAPVISGMLSDLPKPATLSSIQPGSTNEAVSFFTNLTVDSGKATIRLRCTIPTWSSATDTCVDLYDLHELKSRALDLIHELLVSLRSSGMTVSYSLAPSDSSICIVSESQRLANFDVLEKVMRRRLERGNVALLTIDGSPCLVLA